MSNVPAVKPKIVVKARTANLASNPHPSMNAKTIPAVMKAATVAGRIRPNSSILLREYPWISLGIRRGLNLAKVALSRNREFSLNPKPLKRYALSLVKLAEPFDPVKPESVGEA